MITFIIICFAVYGVFLGITSYAKKLETETINLAISIAKNEEVQNDFSYVWKRFALIMDRGEKEILLCEHSGDWEVIPRDECNYNVEIGNGGNAIRITTRDFDNENNYLFMGKREEILDLERRIKSVLHW